MASHSLLVPHPGYNYKTSHSHLEILPQADTLHPWGFHRKMANNAAAAASHGSHMGSFSDHRRNKYECRVQPDLQNSHEPKNCLTFDLDIVMRCLVLPRLLLHTTNAWARPAGQPERIPHS